MAHRESQDDLDSAVFVTRLLGGEYGLLDTLSLGLINRGLLRDNFVTTTWLLIGASIYIPFSAILPTTYLAPALVLSLLVRRLLRTLLQAAGVVLNPRMEGVVVGKTAAQIPRSDGMKSRTPADRQVCVFLLGARSNHPFGMLAPGYKALADYADDMYVDLDAKRRTNGFLGMSTWLSNSRSSSNEIMAVMYFDNTESVHAFAHSSVHLEGWRWWNANLPKHVHIAIKHEIFMTPAKAWEGVYINYHPTGLGAIKVPITDGMGDGETVDFADTLVDASKGVWRSSAGRLGGDPKVKNYDGYARDPYAMQEE